MGFVSGVAAAPGGGFPRRGGKLSPAAGEPFWISATGWQWAPHTKLRLNR